VQDTARLWKEREVIFSQFAGRSSVGRAAAVADVFGLRISGFLAWIVWAFIHLMYLVTFQSRLLVFFQWAIQYLTFSRSARLINAAVPSDFNFNEELSELRTAPETKAEPTPTSV
jgi:NADH:ubiquinone reductase (H+-translocating)